VATMQHPPTSEDPHERSSITPHEAEPRPSHLALPRWSLPLLGGLALLVGGVTVMHPAWRGDQGSAEVSLASNTEPTSQATPADPGKAKPKLVDEQDEDGPLPSALPFDEYVARKALELRAQGLACGKPGRIDLKVSFAPSGSSTRAEVTLPRLATTRVARCVSERLSGVSIPAFQGNQERSVQVSVAVR